MSIMKQILDYIFSGEVSKEAFDQSVKIKVCSGTKGLKLGQCRGATLMFHENNLPSDVLQFVKNFITWGN